MDVSGCPPFPTLPRTHILRGKTEILIFMPHLCYDPGNSKHCEITSAILGRASGQTKLNKRLFINPHFLNALGLYLPALLYP